MRSSNRLRCSKLRLLLYDKDYGNEINLYFGYVDANNYYSVGLRNNNTELTLLKVVAGAATVLSVCYGTTPMDNGIIRILKDGPNIQVYLNGELMHRVKEPTFNGTKIGIRSFGGSTSLIDAVVAFSLA